MKPAIEYLTREELQRARHLGHVGAGQAAVAFSTLMGSELRAAPPTVRVASEYVADDEDRLGVIFEMSGTVPGLIALFLPQDARVPVLNALCRRADPTPELAASALREVGNIVASHAVSAVADLLGGRITLSPPVLVDAGGQAALGEWLSERREGHVGLATESALCEIDGACQALLVFAPDAP